MHQSRSHVYHYLPSATPTISAVCWGQPSCDLWAWETCYGDNTSDCLIPGQVRSSLREGQESDSYIIIMTWMLTHNILVPMELLIHLTFWNKMLTRSTIFPDMVPFWWNSYFEACFFCSLCKVQTAVEAADQRGSPANYLEQWPKRWARQVKSNEEVERGRSCWLLSLEDVPRAGDNRKDCISLALN